MTLPFSAKELADWTGGRLLEGQPDARFRGVSIDSREVESGQLFVAIRGPRNDGHDYLEQAIATGVTGLLVERGAAKPLASKGNHHCIVECDDTTLALGLLAKAHRAGFDGPVVAITGSNGKTTTKEMCASILSVSQPCLKNPGNWNNAYGLPLALLRRDADCRSIVVEIGMNHRGEIAPLADIANPTVAIVTNVGTAHIENLGTQEAIADEKGDLLARLDPKGTAVVNADDPRVMAQSQRTQARCWTFGLGGDADFRAVDLRTLGERGHAFQLVTPAGTSAAHVAGLSEVNVANALAAAAGAMAAGASLDDVVAGLAHYRPIGGRMESVTLPRNIIVINDTYNANPQSMEVALRSLAELKGTSRGIAVLGDMGELGATSQAAHRATGQLLAELELDFVFAIGAHAEDVAMGATTAGMARDRVRVAKNHAEASRGLREMLQGNDWVLVKGSRSMQMERIVEDLCGEKRS